MRVLRWAHCWKRCPRRAQLHSEHGCSSLLQTRVPRSCYARRRWMIRMRTTAPQPRSCLLWRRLARLSRAKWCAGAHVHARANTITDSAQAELGLNKTQRGYVSLALKQWSGERAAAERASAAASLEQARAAERASAAASLEQALERERASAAAALEQALERERVSAAAALDRERKKRFMAGITAFAGSASEASLSGHAWGADTRRGLRPAEQDCSMEQVLLRDFPHVAAATVTSAWAAFKDRARRAIKPEDVKSHERARVHPVLRVLVACAMMPLISVHDQSWTEILNANFISIVPSSARTQCRPLRSSVVPQHHAIIVAMRHIQLTSCCRL